MQKATSLVKFDGRGLRRFWEMTPKHRAFRYSVSVIPIRKETDLETSIKIEDLKSISEYKRAILINEEKPLKSLELLAYWIKEFRSDHIGLPVYNHLLELYAGTLLKVDNIPESELQYKNCIEHSKNTKFFDAEYRVSTIVVFL